MSKLFIGIFAGVFVGAMLHELFNRADPGLFSNWQEKTCNKIMGRHASHPESEPPATSPVDAPA